MPQVVIDFIKLNGYGLQLTELLDAILNDDEKAVLVALSRLRGRARERAKEKRLHDKQINKHC